MTLADLGRSRSMKSFYNGLYRRYNGRNYNTLKLIKRMLRVIFKMGYILFLINSLFNESTYLNRSQW